MRSISRRLNAWQRLAVVLTTLWLIVATYHFWFAHVDANYTLADETKSICEHRYVNGDPGSQIERCDADYNREMTRYGEERWGLLGATFLLISTVTAAFWLAVWIAFRIARWVWAGRDI